MNITPITEIDQVKVGDTIAISDGSQVITAKAKIVITEYDGTDVIYNKKKNRFFNIGMYLAGESWVKDAAIITA